MISLYNIIPYPLVEEVNFLVPPSDCFLVSSVVLLQSSLQLNSQLMELRYLSYSSRKVLLKTHILFNRNS